MDRAVAAAAAADTAIVMVGTNDEWETEGFDREAMDLPGRQNELVERVVAANPNTVVVVNAGSPVTLDWAAPEHDAPRRRSSCRSSPGRSRPRRWPTSCSATPTPAAGSRSPSRGALGETPAVLDQQPDVDSSGNKTLRYGEGLFIGYRWYDARAIPPRFAFGHGLSYGAAEWGEATASASTIAPDGTVEVTMPVTATGDRDATVVVQGYVAPIDPACTRPDKELKVWAKRIVPAGTTDTVTLTFGPEAFHHWDPPSAAGWSTPGEYDLVLAASAVDERRRMRVTVEH